MHRYLLLICVLFLIGCNNSSSSTGNLQKNFIVSEDQKFSDSFKIEETNSITTPEPSSLALISLGLIPMLKRRKKWNTLKILK